MSPDGVCRPFDEKAHGTVPGKGAGIVVLKRVSDAVADGDTIYAVIAGSAWNNDGADKVGYTAPSVAGQAEVIRMAQAAAGIGPERIGYVEAHGTGTELGDPIEVAALAEVFGERESGAARCVLGSVKANMGHTDVAAGVAGLIKAALSVHYGLIPPTPHFDRPNPALLLEQTAFKVSAGPEPWPELDGDARWAGVSSFGIGGTNVHVCLRNAPVSERQTGDGPWVFPVSAKSQAALDAGVQRLAGFLKAGNDELSAVAATLQAGRRAYEFRRSFVTESREELASALEKTAKATTPATEAATVAFLFPGQGQQFAGMADALLQRDARFREWIERGLLELPVGLAEEMRGALGMDAAAMPTRVAQPLLFLVEYALAQRWMELGVQPGVLLGHSLGELTAAAVAGVFSFEDGLRLAAERGRLMQETPEGAMLAVSRSADELRPELSLDLWIAAENAPKLTVISGPVAAIDVLEKKLTAQRVASVRLATDRAFHTPDMEEAAAKFEAAVACVERKAPRLRWLSNVTGTWITAAEATSAGYWAEQMTSRVRFAENAAALAGLAAQKSCFLLEVGPGEALTALVRQQGKATFGAGFAASSLGGSKRRGDDLRAFLEAAGLLWERGVAVRWEGLPGFLKDGVRRVALPTYPFERERFWVEATTALGTVKGSEVSAVGLKLEDFAKRSDMADWFYVPTWVKTPAAPIALRKVTDPVGTWVLAGAAGELEDRLAAKLAEAGATVLRLPMEKLNGSELETFWKGNYADGGWGLVYSLDSSKPDSMHAVNDGYAGLMELVQTGLKARVRLTQVELLVDGLLEVLGERVDGTRRGIVEGLIRMLPAEFAGLRARIIDPGFAGGSAGELEVTAERLVAELGGEAPHGDAVAYRAGRRWQKQWLPVRLPVAAESRFRRGGTYLVTGGVGGIGFTLARHLLQNYDARVAVVGRTALPSREHWEEWLTEHGRSDATSVRIARVKELEALGGDVLVLTADVADREAMAGVWQTVESRLGAVHGVIHSAGLSSNERVAAQTVDGVESVLRPKVQGSEVLAGLAMGKNLDFLLLCSSISSVLPVPGASAYAAANAFQDGYVAWCRQELSVPAVSVNMPAWREVGMVSELMLGAPKDEGERIWFESAVSSAEGIEMLERVLASGEGRVLVSTVDFERIRMPRSPEPDLLPKESGSNAGGGTVALAEGEAVAAMWRELLGVDRVEPTDNFFAMGGHSLLGTMVLARIRERFGVELGIRAIFEAPTPESLGERIRAARLTSGDATSGSGGVEAVNAGRDREEFEF